MVPEPTPASWSAPPAQPTANPMAVHVKVIAILELVWGVLAALGAIVLLFAFGVASAVTGGAGVANHVPGFLASLGLLLAIPVAALAILALLGGSRLLKHRRSGRTLTYVSAALSLLSFPFGTAFGIYAFIILTRTETDQLLAQP